MADYKAAGERVRRRREELNLKQGELPPSSATWRKVERAIDPPYARQTIVQICQALGWTTDSYDRLLRGDEPTPATTDTPWELLLNALEELRDQVHRLADQLEGQSPAPPDEAPPESPR